MSVTAASFKARFPEFTNADDDLVDEVLTRASALCPESVWEDLADQGTELRAAIDLAKSPYARSADLVNKDGSTVYDDRLNELKRVVSSGGRVI